MADFNQIAQKWQKRWAKSKIFEVKEDPKKKEQTQQKTEEKKQE